MRQRRALGIPTLAMVDAFVGGVAVILILTILSSLSDASTATIPRPDRVVTCFGDLGVRIAPPEGEEGDPVETTFEGLAQDLAALAPSEALSMRILIRTPVDGARACVAYVNRALGDANDLTDADALGYAAPVFLVDTEYVDAEPSDEP